MVLVCVLSYSLGDECREVSGMVVMPLVGEHEGEARPAFRVGVEVEGRGIVLARHRFLVSRRALTSGPQSLFGFLGKFSNENKGLYRRTLCRRIPDPVSAQGPSAPKGAPP